MFSIRRGSERRTVPRGVGDELPTVTPLSALNDDSDDNAVFEFTVNAIGNP